MKQSNIRYIILGVVALGVVGFLISRLHERHDVAMIVNDPNPCAEPTVAKAILARVSEIQQNNGGKLIATDMQDVTTTSRSADGAELSCHAVFVMSNNDRTPGSFTLKRNVAGQPVMQFTPDGSAAATPLNP